MTMAPSSTPILNAVLSNKIEQRPGATFKISAPTIISKDLCNKGHNYKLAARPRCASCSAKKRQDDMNRVKTPAIPTSSAPSTYSMVLPQLRNVPPTCAIMPSRPVARFVMPVPSPSQSTPQTLTFVRTPVRAQGPSLVRLPKVSEVTHTLPEFLHLPFFRVQHVLFGPLSIRSGNREEDCEVFIHDIRVPEQFLLPLRARKLDIQLRFYRMKETGPEIGYPAFCEVTLNGLLIGLNGRLSANVIKRSVLEGPLLVGQKFNFSVANRLKCRWRRTNTDVYYAAAVIVEKLTIDRLVQEVSNRRTSKEESKQLIKKGFPQDDDVRVDNFCASLLCPCSAMRIEKPARSVHCDHVRCFDLKNFIMLNEKRGTWKCPVCCKSTPLSSIMVDEYFVEILEQMKGDSRNEIEFLPDATWRVLHSNASNNTVQIDRNSKVETKESTVDEAETNHEVPAVSTSTSSPVSKTRKPEEVIVLDDEEEFIRPSTITANSPKSAPAPQPPVVPVVTRGARKRKTADVRCESPTMKMLRIECVDENGDVMDNEEEIVRNETRRPARGRGSRSIRRN